MKNNVNIINTPFGRRPVTTGHGRATTNREWEKV